MTFPSTITTPPEIARLFTQLDEIRERWTTLIPHAIVAQEICDQFAESIPGIAIGCTYCGDQVWIEAPVKSYADIIAIRREVADRGYRFNGKTEYPSENRETHSYDNIIVHATFPHSGPSVCRYVQTGTKTVPTYELKCDDGGAK